MTNPEVENARLRARVAELEKELVNTLASKIEWREECRRNNEVIRIRASAALRADRVEAELEALRLADARRTVAMDRMRGYMVDLNADEAVNDVITDYDLWERDVESARELLAKHEAE